MAELGEMCSRANQSRRTTDSEKPEGIPGLRVRGPDNDPLVMENLLLARWVAGRYVGRGLDRDDLDQAAVLGLMRAAELFDPRRGTKFTTYATWWCRQFVRRAIDKESRTIRLPEHVVQSLGRRARTQACGEQVPPPTACEVAALKARSVTSPDEDEEHAFEPSDHADGPVELAQQAERSRSVRSALARLPDRLRTVMQRRYGIDCEPENLRQIGTRLGVSRERARQLETEALRRLVLDSAMSRHLL